MPRAKSLLKGGALLLCLGLLGFAGKKAGQQMARSGIIDRTVSTQKAAKTGEAAPQQTRKKEAARADMAASTLKRLNALVERSPNSFFDLEAQAQMDDLIGKLNAAELGELYLMLDQGQDSFRVLSEKLATAWMIKDPDAALRGLLEKKAPGYGNWQVRTAFSNWAQDHPEDAFAWLDSAELPEEFAKLRDELRGNAMYGLIERDFERTTAEFLKIKRPEGWGRDEFNLMGAWGDMYADDPLMRGRLLEFAKSTGNPRDHAELNHELLKAWPQEDTAGMMSYLYELKDYQESGAIPADQRLQSDGTAVAAAIYREYDQAGLMWWMQEHSDSREAPAPMREAMTQWQNKYPDKVQAWFDEQPPSVQRDALASSLIPTLIQKQQFTDAARWIAGMGDAEIRQAASERLEFMWKEQDANAAAAWKAGLGGGVGK
ncbi:hypothetical protein [Haloferula sp. BvORR071]|uniref:hypothetical protein n=1 Tax=Haloferula sp. BvORR071 TaxID=1396141 RepID=UPI0005594966|nr:hypothetical protein [Haloferula sp. BvORR071]